MSKLSSILQQRFRKKENPKMIELAEKTSEGTLTVFSSVFGTTPLGLEEKALLSDLLQKYSVETSMDIDQDLVALIAITSEVKAINNQAAILHGERIKKAQKILTRYRDGAFTAWLMTAYGNRQTPYNFMQYYEFYSQMPKPLHPQIEAMPRQAVYTLASRTGDPLKKEELVRNYNGETKQQLISQIRSLFPLEEGDRRREDVGESCIKAVHRLVLTFQHAPTKLLPKQRESLLEELKLLISLVETK